MVPFAKVFAPAKVNLTLHVTGQRKDGYHLLDSLVVFADVGDRVAVQPADAMSLDVTGPQAAGVPTDDTNLVWKAAALFEQPVAITLSKHLPAAAGIGGGSSDAAATLLALSDITGERRLPEGVADLGADVRVCLMRQAALMSGIGEVVVPVPHLPPLHAVLANPGVEVPTPTVFKALDRKQNKPMPAKLPRWQGTRALIDWLGAQRNDLEAPAIGAAPVIADVLEALSGLSGARLTRMSGSGATCFALFDTRDGADIAAAALAQDHPGWWVAPATLT
ncbi:4-(cytidine 5'-diphospho)-2-C-methyl-D-erythritol kinase [Maritimibacter sp. UBA3975]|uniref:4-(cytidine 5'-diphospho)-2-C-methyl-D-erythritol kinase n=1 Tax=Maritimibacter sp. UBA3975 TaxID=1946833 RepID=UPI000C0B12B1|nr:4-(cytidine 5'-diphospho)-2-C-methyl-D-erythritol kinase [Maritimibacter sp. UBA3975]MAM61827.1 4-(cytidine 5'-diphospho)-2-C-methyl-D-erythritol kinase [Maritimibacter sp.]|tara:strand:+ start:13060 stop:13893 length:834 start_codon:yes stop_codon:yes gene_type:complete